ncbi:MAG: peptidoglycan-binding protein [Deltaproteobacteria bacterium]|nr:MAG: peptidoglycan-binding protein [Deltaproteobacteria bacterium]
MARIHQKQGPRSVQRPAANALLKKLPSPPPAKPSVPSTSYSPGAELQPSVSKGWPDWTAAIQRFLQGGQALQMGQTNDAVREMQQLLNRWGVQPPLATSGVFDAMTEAAVRAFQAARGVEVNGVFGPEMLQALRDALRERDPSGQSDNLEDTPKHDLQSLLSDHTVQVAELEEERKRNEHESPIRNVRNMPTHGTLKPMMVSQARLPSDPLANPSFSSGSSSKK